MLVTRMEAEAAAAAAATALAAAAAEAEGDRAWKPPPPHPGPPPLEGVPDLPFIVPHAGMSAALLSTCPDLSVQALQALPCSDAQHAELEVSRGGAGHNHRGEGEI